jgi:MarR family transcriptional regulator, organic hydroperoxide resistance regulator
MRNVSGKTKRKTTKQRRAGMDVLNNEILGSFFEINKALNNLIKLEADRLGITMVQLKALVKISSNPDIGLGELADKLRLTNSTVSGVIERLVQLELVDRVVPPENRRVVSIHLTEKGRWILDQVYRPDSILVKKLNHAFELPEEDISELLRLQKMVLTKLLLQEESE